MALFFLVIFCFLCETVAYLHLLRYVKFLQYQAKRLAVKSITEMAYFVANQLRRKSSILIVLSDKKNYDF